jgi:hypothetical protein
VNSKKIYQGTYGSHPNATIYDRLLDLTEMESILFKNGEFQLVSIKDISHFSETHFVHFGHKYAMFTIPTLELIDSLKELIGDDHAVEIGSGCGVIGKALGIKCTDNYCQNFPEVREYYRIHHQNIISYGKHVQKRDAEWVARKWRPDVIFGSWITHKYSKKLKSGNTYGPDEELILDNCRRYILLGNGKTHDEKPIMKYKPDIIEKFPGYITKSAYPDYNKVYIWKGRK